MSLLLAALVAAGDPGRAQSPPPSLAGPSLAGPSLAGPSFVAPSSAVRSLAEARHALGAGRLDQARTMISAAVAAGATGEQVDELLADLASASGDASTALAGYETLLARRPGDPLIAERAGIAALRLGQLVKAISLLDRATAGSGASWRGWNARGVAADLASDWNRAEAAYARAALLGPEQSEIANNRGWSLLLRGEWEEALGSFERAAALDPYSQRTANNLGLARSALAEQLPQRRVSETDDQWAARLNDAGVAAAARGQRSRAVAAFAQAIELRSQWFARAATNLAAVTDKK